MDKLSNLTYEALRRYADFGLKNGKKLLWEERKKDCGYMSSYMFTHTVQKPGRGR
jgi:hypothetical protein